MRDPIDEIREALAHPDFLERIDAIRGYDVAEKRLLDRLEAAERDAAHQKALAASALRVAEGWERKCGELRVELETERMRLAACGVVALANTPDSAKQAREMRPEYWSASCGDVARMVDENIKLLARIREMERQEPVAWTTKLALRHGANALGFDACAGNLWGEKGVPLYTLPGAQPAPSLASNNVSLISEGKTQPAQSVKDAIIDDLQSQFDTEGITEHDSGDALIRLSDAIAAVEDNFAQPAPSICPAALSPIINWLRNGCDPRKAADELEMLAAAPETKP